MKKDSLLKQWLKVANSDLEAAKDLLKTKKFLQSLFFRQQTLEKTIKTFLIYKGIEPPYIHNLLRLIEVADLQKDLTAPQNQLLNFINPHYIKARYPDYKERLAKNLSSKIVASKLIETENLSKWIKKKIKF